MAEESLSYHWNTLNRTKHIEQLMATLSKPLPKQYEKFVPSQTWAVYWITQSLSLLEETQFLNSIKEDAIKFIRECAHKDGGYGGGPGQIAHLATSFAAVNALITGSCEQALDSIDRINLVRFLHRMKQADGSFTMHDDGEIDSRASYCALAIISCLNIRDSILTENVAEWILSCQTYEGGFASVPGAEAHGGYTFCCVASLCLLNQLTRANVPALLRWLANRQMSEEGGFSGRSNKDVDSCYSYWQGAVFPLLHPYLKKLLQVENDPQLKQENNNESNLNNLNERESNSDYKNNRPRTRSSTIKKQFNSCKGEISLQLDKLLKSWLFDCGSLQDYVLNQCQPKSGLLRDKPGATPDIYHTCYALSGLSLSQHQPNDSIFDIGSQPINILAKTHPLFNLTLDNLNFCLDYFKNKPIQTLNDSVN